MYKYDYLIVGSGLAGLYAAYEASKKGNVILITKSELAASNSFYAQGGIAAVTDTNDSPQYHYEDTITAGRGLCDLPAVEILVNEGPERIKELIEDGMHFDMQDGSLALGLEGGHHRKRILHAGGDATGRLVTTFMIEKIKGCSNVTILEQHNAIQLLVKDNHCYGVRVWDHFENMEKIIYARHTFLTAGGAGAIYRRTTNPETTIGDGIALAYEAGCEIFDIEFIQFHPSALYTPTGEAFLVSEAVRGEGAHLYNNHGERFMLGKHELAELAPRDIVAQAIFKEMEIHHEEHVWLSLKHIEPAVIKHRFPTIYAKCKTFGYDMTDRIPVAPAAHYTVGGVRTNINGETNIENLYICGELAASGIMGANRLASNSLIECLVFGKRAIEKAFSKNVSGEVPVFQSNFTFNQKYHELFQHIKEEITDIMSHHAGIVRQEEGLKLALRKTIELEGKLPKFETEYHINGAKNLLSVAKLIINGALYRKESRGGHFREDYPKTEDHFKCHIVQQKNKEIRSKSIIL